MSKIIDHCSLPHQMYRWMKSETECWHVMHVTHNKIIHKLQFKSIVCEYIWCFWIWCLNSKRVCKMASNIGKKNGQTMPHQMRMMRNTNMTNCFIDQIVQLENILSYRLIIVITLFPVCHHIFWVITSLFCHFWHALHNYRKSKHPNAVDLFFSVAWPQFLDDVPISPW